MISSPDKKSPIIVAFCGAKGHGKDTAAAVLLEQYGFQRISFCDGLRKTVCTALREDESFFLDPDTKEDIDPRTGKPRRYWLQWIGTEGFRALWENVWVEWWKAEVLERGLARVVVTDLRFPNELEAIRSLPNSMVLRVTNPTKPASGDAHASEAHFKSFAVDADITNGTTVDALQKVTAQIVRERFGIPRIYTNSILR